MKKFDRRRRNFLYLLFSILFGILSGYIFLSFPPDHLLPLGFFQIPILPLFFISLATLIFSIATFLSFEKLQGVIFVLFILGYIFMRIAGLTHWIFGVMMLALFITIELFVSKKK